MAIFSAIGTAIAGALFGGSLLAAKLIAGGLAFGAKYLVNAYLGRKKRRTYAAVQGETQIGGAVPCSTLYGIGKTDGQRLGYFKWGSGNAINAEVFRLAHGWCDGLEPYVYFYGEKYTLVPRTIIGGEIEHWGVEGFGDLVSIRFYDGRPGQTADAKLVADTAGLGKTWKATSTCAGLTYVIVERRYDAAKFGKGRPTFSFVMRGLRMYDPCKDDTVAGGEGDHRLDNPATWEFGASGQNPALQRLNYQLGLRGLLSGRTLIGEGKSLGQIDLSSYFAAMNVCDTLRAGKPTYQSSLWVSSDDDHTEILKEFDDAMAGYGLNRGGLSGVIVGAPQIPVIEITADDLPLGRPREIQKRKSAFDLYNQLSGQFVSPEKNWEPESLKPIVVNADVAADGRARGTSNDFLQVTDPDIAQYLLTIRYRQNRKGGSATIPVSRRVGLLAHEGSWVTFEGKDWLVRERSFDEQFRFSLALAETGADVYDDEDIEPGPIVVPPPALVNPSLLSTVAGFGVEVGMQTGSGGEEVPHLRFTWTPPADPSISEVRFYYLAGNDPVGATIFEAKTSDVESGEYITSKDVRSGSLYTARATITTVPDRFKTFTAWVTTATSTGQGLYPAGVAQLRQDLYTVVQRLHQADTEMRASIEQIALAAAEAAGVTAEEHGVARRFQGATAGALLTLTASIELVDGALTALGEIVAGVFATVGGLSASGLWRMQAVAGSGDVVARIELQVRATIGDDWVSAATVWEAGFVGGDPDAPFSRFLVKALDFIVTDGTDDAFPFVFSAGVARLNVAHIGTVTAGIIKSPDDKFVINLAAGSLEWFE